MKHFLTTALMCGTAILAAQAQNVIVTDKDGIPHKYNADYVQEITFEKIETPVVPDAEVFDNLNVQAYDTKNFLLQFSNGKNYVQLNLFQPSAYYLQPGEYVVRGENELGSYDDFSIDKDFYWMGVWDETFNDYKEHKVTLSSGTLDVKLDGEVYTMTFDLAFEEGENIRGTYTGTINKFGPILHYDLASCMSVDVNEPANNGFYYRFYDGNYNVEMRIDFFTDGFAVKPGTYTFSDTNENGTASSKVDIYSPYVNTKFKEGTVTVSEADGKTVIDIEGTLDTGVKVIAKYNGELPPRNLTFNKAYISPTSFTQKSFTIEFSNGAQLVQLELYQPNAEYVQPGEYVVRRKNGLGAFDDFSVNRDFYWVGVWDANMNDYASYPGTLDSGTVNITLARNLYTMTVDLTFENGERIVGTYNGPLESFGPDVTLDYELAGCNVINMNEPAPNGFYYRFYDMNYTLEMRVDLFSDGFSVKPGTYTFSDTKENGTASSAVDFYSPYESTKFKEGTVTISEVDGKTVVEIDGTLETGVKMKAKYTGELPARNLTFDKAYISPSSFTQTSFMIEFSNGTQLVQLELYQPNGEYVQTGEYVVRDRNSVGSFDDYSINKGVAWIGVWDEAIGDYASYPFDISSGTVNITLSRNIYTMAIELVSADGETIAGTYTGLLESFGPETIEYTLTGCYAIQDNNPAPNGFYYRFYDEAYSLEMRIDLFSEGDKVAPGTYTFSDTKENGTASSIVDFYYPYENTKFKEGTVTVSEADGKTVLEIVGTLENALKVKAVYKGELPARQTSE